MYYLDLFSLHRTTLKVDRIVKRKELNRDQEMSYKLSLQRNRCFYCGINIDMAGHLDHLIPIYYGGLNRSSNLVASCRSCNLIKGTDHIEITNEYTINDYKKLITAKQKYDLKCKLLGKKYLKHKPRKVILYGIYHADLFKYHH